MLLIKSLIGVVFLPLLITYNLLLKQPSSTIIKGIVVNKTTGKPLNNVYLYVVAGEEEALTNENGTFAVTTWQKLPVILHIQRANFQEEKIKVEAVTKKLRIELKE